MATQEHIYRQLDDLYVAFKQSRRQAPSAPVTIPAGLVAEGLQRSLKWTPTEGAALFLSNLQIVFEAEPEAPIEVSVDKTDHQISMTMQSQSGWPATYFSSEHPDAPTRWDMTVTATNGGNNTVSLDFTAAGMRTQELFLEGGFQNLIQSRAQEPKLDAAGAIVHVFGNQMKQQMNEVYVA